MNRATLENARMLSQVLGTSADAAMHLLDRCVVVTTDDSGSSLGADVVRLLSRSVRNVTNADKLPDACAVEVVIGTASARTTSSRIYVSMSRKAVRIASTPDEAPVMERDVPSLLVLVIACYTAGAVVRQLVGDGLPYPTRDPLMFSPEALLGDDRSALSGEVDIGTVHLAGAGAIGNAFLFALGRADVKGEVHVVDPDVVEEGNLNRTLLFEDTDLRKPKATALVEHAGSLLPKVRLHAHAARLQDLATSGAWLEQLVCTVDSRRARRALQEELPRDVYDASTSGLSEVVLHFNSVISGGACLTCMYYEDPREAAHEEHVATMLGISTGEVRQTYLSDSAARAVLTKHPSLAGRQLVGLACDTLFKELCATGSLGPDSGQQVLAPLAFVSALAGTMLALEFVRRRFRRISVEPFNEWHLSPWAPPLLEGRRSRRPREGCMFCGRREVRSAVVTLWQVEDEPKRGGAKEG